ncbi:MAG: hypothetical protein IKN41_04755 [Candidatus Methanomethylophilaceae archaeon]|nr:hypothetical protein [Candidatus Methanomethylophilaceae archaeon]
MSTRSAIYLEAILCFLGMRSFSHAVGTCLAVGLSGLALKGKVIEMFEFYIPEVEYAAVYIVLCALVAGILGAVATNCMRKKDSNGAGEPWEFKYITTTAIIAIAAPILSWLLVGMCVQYYFPQISLELYIILIMLATLPICKWSFRCINDGPKAMFEEIVGDVSETRDGIKSVKRQIKE